MTPMWTLDEQGNPVPCSDSDEWAKMHEDVDRRRVARDAVGDVEVSTVFLGIDHNWGGGPPLLFETMIFGGKHDEYQERYSTRAEAIAGHARALEMVKQA